MTLMPTSSASAKVVTLDGVRVALHSGTTQVVTVNRTSRGAIGYGGLVKGSKRNQGTSTTPLGTYRLLGPFGTHTPPTTWLLAYRQIQSEDYWVQDNGSSTSFNYHAQLRHRGAGMFLHVNGPGATAGCASATLTFMRAAMTRLDRKRVPLIAIGR